MKRFYEDCRTKMVGFWLLLFMGAVGCSSAEASSASAGADGAQATVDAHVSVLMQGGRKDHPRLFLGSLNASQVGALGEHDAALTAIAELSRLAVDCPPLERTFDGVRMLDVSRKAILLIGSLAGDYRLNGNRDPKVLAAAKRHLLAIVRFKDWNPHQFLDTAEMTFAAAIGYDWFYDQLDEDVRSEIRAAIIDKGLKPSLAEPPMWWIGSTINWNQVCHASLISGALAVHEFAPESARSIVTRALIHMPRAMDELYPPTGNYYEGPGYWAFGTQYNIIAIEALRSVLGSDVGLAGHRGLLASATFQIQTHGPTRMPFNYGDCGSKPPQWSIMAAMWPWFRRETAIDVPEIGRPRSDWHPSLDNMDNRFVFLAPLWASPRSGVPAELPLDYFGDGKKPIACFRSSWHDPAAVYLGVSGGSPGTNHGHMDVGGFVFEADGVRWAVDLGAENYSQLERAKVDLWNMHQDSSRWDMFRLGQRAHNILILPGGSQRVTGHAPIGRLSTEAARPGCSVDLTSIYAGQASSVTRTFGLPGRAVLEIVDEITSLSLPGTVRWQIMTMAKPSITADGRGFVLAQDGKTLGISVGAPADVRLCIEGATPDHSYESPNRPVSVLVVERPALAGEFIRFQVVLTPGSRSVP